MVLLYIYTTRIIVYMIESTIPFRREWLGELVDEAFTLVFYVTAGWVLF